MMMGIEKWLKVPDIYIVDLHKQWLDYVLSLSKSGVNVY